jgi:hypothetical protein
MEEVAERLKMPLSECVDASELWMLATGDDSHRNVLVGRFLDAARGIDSGAVAVKQQRYHHLRRIRPLAASILLLNPLRDSAEVKLGDDFENEERQVIVGQPLAR